MTVAQALTHEQCMKAAQVVAQQLRTDLRFARLSMSPVRLYGVPRGGIPAAYLVATALGGAGNVEVVDSPALAHAIIDDIEDSGKTRARFKASCPATPFYTLFKRGSAWLVFPWEATEVTSAEDIPTRLLQFVGEDPTREGLRETPARFVKAWRAYTDGYNTDPASVLKSFEDGGEKYDELVLVRDIPVYSHCEHHLAPFFGRASVAYIPNGRVVGLSKLARLVDVFARRLQVQERMTQQIANALNDALQPRGVGVVVECRHMCMEARGVRTQGSSTTTSCLLGVLKTDTAARAEFLRLIR